LVRNRSGSLMLTEYERHWILDAVCEGPEVIGWIKSNQINIHCWHHPIMHQLICAEALGCTEWKLIGTGPDFDSGATKENYMLVTLEVYF
jgi:hypothetical protein